MKFLIDAQLPYRLALYVRQKGYQVIHTDDLPNKERTTDNEIRQLSVQEDWIVITKDSDFLDSYYLKRIPPKLLLISTGNIKNQLLLSLFEANLENIIHQFETHTLIEMDNQNLIIHE